MTHAAPALAMPDMASVSPATASGHPLGSVRMCTLTDLSDTDHAAWQALCERQAGDDSANIFAQPWLLRAGLSHLAPSNLQLAFVEDAQGNLIGVAPLERATRLGRFPLPHWQIWNHPNSFCAPVLVDVHQGQLFWDLLLTRLAAGPENRGANALLIADCPTDSSAFKTLSRSIDAHSLRSSIEQEYQRALADTATAPFDRYWDTQVRAKKRKELRRQAARLTELGAVSFEELAADASADDWIAEFLALEQAGWKGKAGSALAASPDTAAYFRTVVEEAQACRRLSFLAMRLDGRAIAMLVTLVDGDAAFSFKTAYDETLARFSPGVQIQQANLALFAKRGVRWADSCAAPDHPMIDSLWTERRTITAIAVGLPGTGNQIRFGLYCAAQRVWRTIKQMHQHRPVPMRASDD